MSFSLLLFLVAVCCAPSAAWSPIRMKYILSKGNLQIDHDQTLTLTKQLMPQAIGIWQDILRVDALRHPLFLPRTCGSSFVNDTTQCAIKCYEALAPKYEKCGETVISPMHQDELEVCKRATVVDGVSEWSECETLGRAENGGVKQTDFLIYTQAIQTEDCAIPNRKNGALAWASTCHIDPQTERPISGFINICPSILPRYQESGDLTEQLTTVVHEIGHALGFTSTLMALWRDESNKPRTKRDQCGIPPILSYKNFQVMLPGNETLHFPNPNNVKTAWVVTPNVKQAARKFFACNSLVGVPLENQSPYPIWGAHWEERVLGTELMSGTLNAVVKGEPLSPLTLALFEDTGWYRANYDSEFVSHPTWGLAQGCLFLQSPCIWDGGPIAHPFCITSGQFGCSSDLRSVAECNLQRHKQRIPEQFRYFDDPYLGGEWTMADYCPFYGPKNRMLCSRTPDTDLDTLEVFGDTDVACFEVVGSLSAPEQKLYQTSSTAGCFRYTCESDHVMVYLANGDQARCDEEHQTSSLSTVNASIKCPNRLVLCP